MALTSEDFQLESGVALLGQTLPNLLRAAVDAGPDDTAFVDRQGGWTWHEWWEATEAVARGLQEHGLTTGDVVVAQLPNGWEFLIVHAAVAMAGGVLLPVHLGNDSSALTALARRCGARLVVAPDGRLTPELGELDATVLGAGMEPHELTVAGLVRDFAGTRPKPVRVLPDDPFVLLPSSATTSLRPKICMHAHDGLLSNAAAVVASRGLRRGDSVLSASPFTHLFGLLSVHASLFARTTQLLLPRWDPDRTVALAREATGSVVLFAVPTQVRDLIPRLDDDVRLREVRTGGSKVPAALVDDLRRGCGASVVVQWGMSELGAGLFTSPDDPPHVATSSIGRPVVGARARVVRDGTDCAPGEVGELWVSSPYAFRGYLGDAELTARALPADGWLRTGDMASVNADGLVAFHGRAAELIDVGGQKFSAIDIEEHLADLPGLGPAAVVGRADPRLGQYPCLVVTEGSSVPLQAVTDHLVANGVAEHKIPVELVSLPAIPQTATGKIARRRLADLVDATDQRPQNQVAVTADSLLDLVMTHARAVLPDSPLTPGQVFRERGLSSLGAVRLARLLRDATGLPLDSTVVFDHPTPIALAQHLAHGGAQQPAATPRQEQTDDPLVVVGMGCRLPGGVDSPDELWQLLVDERDAIGPAPADRGWPTTDGLTGGYLGDAAGFDAAFFGIRPTEAAAMDPQQRLLLEVAWETLERAGIDPKTLRDTDTGVFVGMFASDYAPRVFESPDRFEGNLLIGNASSVASGRIAYVLGLHGPAITVDTACSSSLVALHQAVAAIRAGECGRAIAAGVTVMSTPATFVDLGQHGLLAPDGHCKPFSDKADGVGWSEGVGVLVVEPLSTARRDGHPVLAVLAGSAINSDGASNGLTAPNGTAQRAVIRQALANARLTADHVQAVEAHGTGTLLGDPIEAQALLDTYGDRRSPGLWVGSVKSNLGHTQAAAGIVGVIKMVLAIRHRLLPSTLHVQPPTTQVDWSDDTIRLLTEAVPWLAAGPRRAGVSSFGISGTNAHVIIEEPPGPAEIPAQRTVAGPWLLSAATEDGLRALATRLLGLDATDPQDVARTLAQARSSLDHRAAVLPDDYQAALGDLAAGNYSDNVITGRRLDGRTAFVFTGQGQQWPGMATELARTETPFAQAFRACDDALRRHTGWSVAKLSPDRVEVVQASLFAMMVSLAALWRDAGVRPDAVVGHSQGEIVAAHVAGVLSLADAAKIVAVRGRLLGELSGTGAMASVLTSADEAIEVLAAGVSIAAVNGPRALVISGDVDGVHETVARLRERDVPARVIAVDFASHSSHVDRLLPRLRDELADITPQPSEIPFYSTVTGDRLDGRTLTADYWCRNLRDVVNLHGAIDTLAAHGFRKFIEVSAHPVLGDAIEQTVPADSAVIESVRRDDATLDRFHRSLAHAHVNGIIVDPRSIAPAGRIVELPTYPFQHQRYWHAVAAPAAPAPEPMRPRDLVSLVREQLAAVAGVDANAVVEDGQFAGLGLPSLAMTELRVRLQRATGVRLPVVALLDHPTPRALGRYLGQVSAPESSTVLSRGPGRPRLVCLPSLTPLSGPTEFDAWATRFRDERDVMVLPEPGFAVGEALPADLDALLDAHAEAVMELGQPHETVLCGHSSGGWIAHALATRLGTVAGVVLIDSFWPDERFHHDVLPWVWSTLAHDAEAGLPAGPRAVKVAAATAYREIIAGWQPGALDGPMLFVQARKGLDGGRIRARWPQPCEHVTVDGDHFTMMTAHADEVTAAIHRWLRTLSQR
ncbi:MAG: acyltransferase domain-containing protein [Streptosporangiaceae bacterium]|nr:acyltransferase domain-containing protein [Pseudonocardiales bacterium]MBV9448854.1 acyltransferase domain-containing protein [Streptosporangiaceae bacterium]